MTLSILIEAHAAAADMFDRAANHGTDEEATRAGRRLSDAVDAIIDLVPATLEESREKARFLADVWERGEDSFGANEMRRLLKSLAA